MSEPVQVRPPLSVLLAFLAFAALSPTEARAQAARPSCDAVSIACSIERRVAEHLARDTSRQCESSCARGNTACQSACLAAKALALNAASSAYAQCIATSCVDAEWCEEQAGDVRRGCGAAARDAARACTKACSKSPACVAACNTQKASAQAACKASESATRTDVCERGESCVKGCRKTEVVCAETQCDPNRNQVIDACKQAESTCVAACINPCASVTCPGDQCNAPGTCNPATGTCSAQAPLTGTTCDDSNSCTRGETCNAGVCGGGSSCDANATCGSSGCVCKTQYAGDGFACAPTACAPGQSLSNGSCSDCPAGTYSPVGTSCTSCPAGTYSSTVGASSSATCSQCPAGTASSTVGANGPSTCSACGVGTFAGSSGSSTCASCGAGYEPVPARTSCVDINECQNSASFCHEHARCTNLPGSYLCTCLIGYQGDGHTCLPYVSAPIDLAAGGTLSGVSGSAFSRASLTIAPGSGTGTTTFSLAQAASVPMAVPPNALGWVVQVLPSGLSLAVAASLSLPWSGSGVTPTVARLDETSVGWVEVTPASYDASTVTVLTKGFSYWVVIDPAGLPNCTNATCSTAVPTFTTPLGASGASWVCIDYPVADNTACTGSNACLRAQACQAGVCTGGSTCAANATCTATGCACNAGFAGDGFTCAAPAVSPSLSYASGAGISGANQNYFAKFVVTTVDQGGKVIYDPSAVVSASAVSTRTSWPVTIVDNGNGTYDCKYLPTKTENVVLTIAVNGVEISNSPAKWSQDIIVKNSVFAPNSALGSLSNAAAGEPQTWSFNMADENFNPVLDWHDNFVLTVTYGFLPGVVFAQSFPGVGALSFTAPFIGLVNATAYVVNDNNNGDDHVLANSPFSCNFQ